MRYNSKRRIPYEPYLMHYGVKGMKWGVRHDYETVGRENKGQQERKHLTAKQKRYIKIGLAVAGTTLAAYGGYKLYQSGIIQNAVASKKASKVLSGDIGDFISEGVMYTIKKDTKEVYWGYPLEFLVAIDDHDINPITKEQLLEALQ